MDRSARFVLAAVLAIVVGLPLVILLLLGSNNNCGATSAGAPAPGTQTAGQMVRYLESQGFQPAGAAGIVGNLQQESSLNPAEPDGSGGGGLAQWNASWYHVRGPSGELSLDAFAAAHGLAPVSMAAQLEYLAWDVQTSYPQLVSELNSASSPEEAATMFETTYEICSGVVAYMVVIPGSLCNDTARRSYAVQALGAAGGAGTSVPVSLSTTGSCCPSSTPVGGSGQLVSLPLPANEMLPGSWSYDAGIDIPAPAGTPEYAVGPGVIVQEGLPGFGPNAPVLKVTGGPLAGMSFYYGHAGPDTVPVGAQVQAGQQISQVGAGIVGISTGPHIEFGLYPAVGGAAVAPILKQLMADGAAAAPSGSAVPVSLSVGGTCAQPVSFTGRDPIPGFTAGRDDMGVDGCAQPGMPIYAPATSVLVEILQGWYAGQPLMLFQFVPPLAGTYHGDQYWYVAEEISPSSETVGTVFQAGQPVATFAPSGSCIEIGWGSPSSNQRTLAGQEGDSGAANPPAGATTVWGETFKQAFGIPWVGQSP
jgi:hypothetical protein